jgi:Zn-dependent M28 family amino/carboxypeptidase
MSTRIFSVSNHCARLVRNAILAFAGIGCAGSQPSTVPPRAQPAAQTAPAKPVPAATAAILPAAAGFEAAFTAPRGDAAAQITADDLREHIAKLASDDFAGRGPTTPGDRKSRAYLIEQLQRLGYQPGGNATWEQAFDLVGVEAHMPKRWTFARDGKSLPLTWSSDYIATSGVQTPEGAIRNAELVFVGYGIEAPEYGWDDFKGKDLRGKVLLMLNDDPNWDDRLFAGKTRLYYGRWTYKFESAERHGAAGAILIHTTPSAGYPFQVVQTSWSGPQYELPKTTPPHVQLTGWVTEAAAQKLVKLAGKDLPALIEAAKRTDFAPVALGVTTSISFKNTVQRAQTANVYGLLPGSDARLRDQVVIYTAHHDHLGVGQPDARGDRIYNGALDNAAGVAQLLAIARAFKRLPEPPRRSILFLFAGAEEQGLLGSAYYAANPSFPRQKIAAAINYDGGNIWGRARDVTFIGKGKSTLDPIVEAIALRQGRTVKGDRLPDRGYFYRSDQFSFAKIGVPAIYIDQPTDFVGKPPGWGQAQSDDYEVHRYHQPSDEFDPKWNFDGMIEDAQLGFWAGVILADQDAMPAWLPGDEFERAR